jgi:hypothetical protein
MSVRARVLRANCVVCPSVRGNRCCRALVDRAIDAALVRAPALESWFAKRRRGRSIIGVGTVRRSVGVADLGVERGR